MSSCWASCVLDGYFGDNDARWMYLGCFFLFVGKFHTVDFFFESFSLLIHGCFWTSVCVTMVVNVLVANEALPS